MPALRCSQAPGSTCRWGLGVPVTVRATHKARGRDNPGCCVLVVDPGQTPGC